MHNINPNQLILQKDQANVFMVGYTLFYSCIYLFLFVNI